MELASYVTPEKEENAPLTDSQITIRPATDSVFSSNSSQIQKSKLTELRYFKSPESECFSTMEPSNSQGKLLTYPPLPVTHKRRKSAHHRKPSIFVPDHVTGEGVIASIVDQTKSPSVACAVHKHTVSDADSVVLGNYEMSIDSLDSLTNNTVIENKENDSLEGTVRQLNRESSMKESYPVLGVTPTMAYCKFCRESVHTEVTVSSVKFPMPFLRVVQRIMDCCNNSWFSDMKVHRCPQCTLVLAKSR